MSTNSTPNEYFPGIIYNSNNFNSSNNYLTLSVADARYLQSTGNPISSATNTTFEGNIILDGDLNSITPTELSYLSGGTQNINIALTNLQNKTTNQTYNSSSNTTTFNDNLIVNNNLSIGAINSPSGLLTPTVLGYLYGASSNLQTQINSIISSTVLLSGSNAWTGYNSYNSNLPTSTLTPTSSYQLVNKLYCDTNFLTSSALTTINSNISILQNQTSQQSYSSSNNQTNFNSNLNLSNGLNISNGNITFSNSSYIDMSNCYIYGGNSQTLPSGSSGGKAGLAIFWNDNINGLGSTTLMNYSQGSIGGFNFYNDNVSATSPSLLCKISATGDIKPSGYFDLTSGNGINTSSGLISNTVMGYVYGTTSNIQSQFNTLFSRTTGQNYNSSIATTEFSSNVYCTGNLQNLSPTIYYYLSGITSNVQSQLTSLQSNTMTISGVKTFSSNIILNNGLKLSTGTTLSNAILNTLYDINTGPGVTIQTQISGVSTQVDTNTTNISTLQNQTTNQTYSSGTTTFNDNVSVTGNLQNLSNTIYSYLSNISSDVQTQINNVSSSTISSLLNQVNTFNVQQIFTDLTSINSIQTARNTISSSSNPKIFCNPGTNIFSITLNPFFAKIITINIPISVYRNVTSAAVLTTRNETLNSITCNLYKNGSFVSSLSVSTNNSLGQLKRFDGSSATWTYEQFITNTSVSFTPTLENATNTYTIQYTMGQTYSSSASGETTISNGYYANTAQSNYSVSGCSAIYSSGVNYSATSYSSVTNTTLNSLMNGEIITNDVLSNNLYVNNVYPSYISPTSLPSLNTNIGYVTQYTYSGSVFTFAGNNTVITSSNTITIPSGVYLINGYLVYYCSSSTQGNPLVNVNVCYYSSGSAGSVVPGCTCNQVYGANLLANRTQQLSTQTVALINSSSNSFCLTWQINLNLTFTCSVYNITAIKIA